MSSIDNPPEHFEVAILGTGLTESILAAALAKAGKKVLHLDENGYYGGDSASLSLSEIIEWAELRQARDDLSPSPYIARQRKDYSSISYAFRSPDAKQELLKESRQYSISLLPSMIPSTGPLIDSLIASGASRYGSFRLLEGTGMYSSSDGEIKRVPSGKEEIFRDKDMSLLQKRQLMKLLMFAASDFEDGAEEFAQSPYLQYLQTKFVLPVKISSAIAFAISHCMTGEDHTLAALLRTRRYLRSAGRYGASPFLIGHYGGAGEISQGFCRGAAVQGATYILGRSVAVSQEASASAGNAEASNESQFSFKLDGFANSLTSDILVSAPEYPLGHGMAAEPESQPTRVIARCIAILDHVVQFGPAPGSHSGASEATTEALPSSPDTFLVVFPPASFAGLQSSTSHENPVFALITGDATMSAPQGKSIAYLSTLRSEGTADETLSAEEILSPYLATIVGRSASQDHQPLFRLFYNQSLSGKAESSEDTDTLAVTLVNPAATAETILTEVGDDSAKEAERVFWKVIGKFRRNNPTPETDGIDSFWPPLEDEGLDGGGDDEEPW